MQQIAACARGGGGSGVNPPPLTIEKEMKTSFFGMIFHFSRRDCRNCYHAFLYPLLQPAYIISGNFHCDTIILVAKP